MAKQDMNLGLTDNKPERGQAVYVDMEDPEEFERVYRIITNGIDAFKLKITGEEDIMKSEFVQILLRPIERKNLLKKYETILASFNEETEYFPPVYEVVRNAEGSPVDVKKTEIGKYFGGWRKNNPAPTRYEQNDELKNEFCQGKVRFYRINIMGDRYIKFLSDIRTLYKMVKFLDVKLREIETTTDIFQVADKQVEYIKTNLERFIESGNSMAESLPYKDINVNISSEPSSFTLFISLIT